MGRWRAIHIALTEGRKAPGMACTERQGSTRTCQGARRRCRCTGHCAAIARAAAGGRGRSGLHGTAATDCARPSGAESPAVRTSSASCEHLPVPGGGVACARDAPRGAQSLPCSSSKLPRLPTGGAVRGAGDCGWDAWSLSPLSSNGVAVRVGRRERARRPRRQGSSPERQRSCGLLRMRTCGDPAAGEATLCTRKKR